MAETIYKDAHSIFQDRKIWQVPPHQRDYAWTTEKIEQLLIDLDSITIKRTDDGNIPINKHFTGLLVFLEQPTDSGIGYYDIIDGQQRLSTIILIAAVSKDVINEILRDDGLDASVRSALMTIATSFDQFIYRECRPGQTKKPKLKPSNRDSELFEMLVLNEGTIDSKEAKVKKKFGKQGLRQTYFKAYKHIYTYLLDSYQKRKHTFFEELSVKLDGGFTFIPFVAETETDAFNLFETLNDRGLQLSAFDLIKNKVLSKAKDDLEKFEVEWSDVFGRKGILSSNKSQFFLRNFLMLRHGHISNNDVYEKCKEHLQTHDSTKRFLKELNEDAANFRAVTVVQDQDDLGNGSRQYIDDDNLSELFFLLNRTRVRQWVSIGYCAYHLYRTKQLSKSDLKTILNLLLNICIRFKILNVRFNYIEKQFPELAHTLKMLKIKKENGYRNITQQNAIKHVIVSLKKTLDASAPNEDLNSAIDEGILFDDNDLAFVILRLLAVSKIKHGLAFSVRQKMTLEHVMPEKYEKTWGKIIDGDSLKYSLGNMLLVEAGANSELKNKTLSAKQKIYKNYNLIDFVNDATLSYKKATQNEWVKHLIKKRELNILEQLQDVLSY